MRLSASMLAVLALVPAGSASSRVVPPPGNEPRATFAWVEYRGEDTIFSRPAAADQYRNPVVAGFYPDPSIVRVGADYYLVNSTFGYFPGLPVWHSRDLVNWTQIANAIDRPGMIDLKGVHLGQQGLYAPTIRHHAGRFVIVNTCVECGGNFVVTAADARGPWSDPIWIKGVGGIDPQIYFEGDRAWLLTCDNPAGPALYAGHKAIWIREIDPTSFQPTGPATMLVNGGVRIEDEPKYVEGPRLFRRNGYYYLSAAEGGTEMDHRQVIWRSRAVMGPYVPDPANPILTQRTLDEDRRDPVASTGHADMVELQDGSWWSVFLATRPYHRVQFNTGRETFLLPVRWSNDWPTILPPGRAVPYVAKRPGLPPSPPATPRATGNLVTREDFTGALPPSWMFVRVPAAPWWTTGKDGLSLTPRSDRLGDGGQPSVVVQRVRHTNATVTTELRFDPRGAGWEAGLVALQNDGFFYAFGLTRGVDERPVLTVRRRAGPGEPARGMVVARARVDVKTAEPIRLRVAIAGPGISFAYAMPDRPFRTVLAGADASLLSTVRSGGFTGATVGPYAERPDVRR